MKLSAKESEQKTRLAHMEVSNASAFGGHGKGNERGTGGNERGTGQRTRDRALNHNCPNYARIPADGKKLTVYSLAALGGGYTLTASQTKAWFGGRILVPEDRLESQGKYFPYGEDRYNPSPANPSNDTEKFATYTRDLSTGLDYAYQRYYNSQVGRFHTVDPDAGSALSDNPQTWNRYPYANGDPVNGYNPTGLYLAVPKVPTFSDPRSHSAGSIWVRQWPSCGCGYR